MFFSAKSLVKCDHVLSSTCQVNVEYTGRESVFYFVKLVCNVLVQ